LAYHLNKNTAQQKPSQNKTMFLLLKLINELGMCDNARKVKQIS